MLKKSKRIISALLAAVMLLSAMSVTAIAEESKLLTDFVGSDENTDLNDIEFLGEIYKTGEVLKTPANSKNALSAANSTRSQPTSVSLNYFTTGVGSLPSNDYIEYYLSAPTARTYAASFITDNPNVRAVLCEYDGTDLWPTSMQLSNGSFTAFILPAGEWCWAVMPVTGTLGGLYQLTGNGSNPDGLTNISAASDLSTVTGWKSGVFYSNGVAQADETVTITSFSGGVSNITYKSYGTRYRIDQKKTLTVNGKVTQNGAAASGVTVTVWIENLHWYSTGGSSDIPYRYSVPVTVTTNSQGNFTAYVTANNAIGSDYITLPGAPYPRDFNHYFDYLTSVKAETNSGTRASAPIYIYAYSEIV